MHYERIDKYMKRVKEIASMLEVSQVTVYNHLKKLDDELKGNIFKKKGVIYVDDEGIRTH
jgi:Mn-dependent DtxR family transcriptional regulator